MHSNRLKKYYANQGEFAVVTDDQADTSETEENDEEQNSSPSEERENLDTEEPAAPKRTTTKKEANTQWHAVKQLRGVKKIQGKRHYLVEWESDGTKTWEPEENISPFLKESYHIKRTMTGQRRKRRTQRY